MHGAVTDLCLVPVVILSIPPEYMFTPYAQIRD